MKVKSDELRPEYDFTAGGARGKYAERYQATRLTTTLKLSGL